MSSETIRPFTKADFEAYYFLRREALRQNPEAFHTRLADFDTQPPEKERRRYMVSVTEPDRFILGAFLPDGHAVGMTGFGRHVTPGYERLGFIWGVFVLEDYRGRSLGRQLMEEASALARAMPQIKAVRLGVMSGNEPAIALYRGLGFELFSPNGDDPMKGSGGECGLYFRLALATD